MSKVIITKNKLKKIESYLWAGLSATALFAVMDKHVSDNVIRVRAKTVKDIMDILNNQKSPRRLS